MNYKEKVLELIKSGVVVCPETKEKLQVLDNKLISEKSKKEYIFEKGIPFFLKKVKQSEYFEESDGRMLNEYSGNVNKGLKGLFTKFINGTIKDYPSEKSRKAFEQVFENPPEDSFFVSVGGGPIRYHNLLFNLNIGAFPNVEFVADAYELPFADNSVDGIFCGAVLEHLEFPEKAVGEMFRVLKSGGKVYCDTPFLQPYHGYPNHYQNFTLTGHQRVFERNNFKILSSGVCVGPTYMFGEITLQFLRELKPSFVSKILSILFLLIIAPFRRIDKRLHHTKNEFVLASTTFVLATK